jgi:hypothetical protein
MDELIANGDDSNEGSPDANLNLMNITSDDDGGGSGGYVVPSGEGALEAEEVQEDDSQKHAYERKPRKKTSPIRKDFKEVVQSGFMKAQCIHCKSILGIPTSSTITQLHKHLNSCIPRIATNKKQKVLTFDSKGGNVSSSANFAYDHKKVRELASHMIFYHEYLFMQME